jgi:hypothetical protein
VAVDLPEPFKCIDCGIEVHRFVELAANDQHLCLECLWLREIEDPEQRKVLRELFRSKP